MISTLKSLVLESFFFLLKRGFISALEREFIVLRTTKSDKRSELLKSEIPPPIKLALTFSGLEGSIPMQGVIVISGEWVSYINPICFNEIMACFHCLTNILVAHDCIGPFFLFLFFSRKGDIFIY